MPSSAATIPPTISAGDSFSWPVAVADYPATSGWTLHLGAACTSPVAAKIVVDAEASGAGYAFNVTPGTSATWKAGKYLFSLYVTRNGGAERVTVGRGAFQVLADPAALVVSLEHAQRTLALLEAALERRIPAGMEETTIDGQHLARIPTMQLSALRDKYRAEVANLERAAAAAAGVRPRQMIYVRFRAPRGPGSPF